MKEKIFNFMQIEDDNLEEFVESFKYSLQRSRHSDLDKNIVKIIFLRALREGSLELFNIVEKGDISKEDFYAIYKLCI